MSAPSSNPPIPVGKLERPVGGAKISPDRRYRYSLWRDLGAGRGECLFVMLNPSTADEQVDDATIRRCRGFAADWGFRKLTVANLYAMRAREPGDLDRAVAAGVDPIGPENDRVLAELALGAGWIVVAWGARREPISGRAAEVAEMLAQIDGAGGAVLSLGVTTGGHPRHPLYLPADVEPESWPA